MSETKPQTLPDVKVEDSKENVSVPSDNSAELDRLRAELVKVQAEFDEYKKKSEAKYENDVRKVNGANVSNLCFSMSLTRARTDLSYLE